jgi:adenylate cyclase
MAFALLIRAIFYPADPVESLGRFLLLGSLTGFLICLSIVVVDFLLKGRKPKPLWFDFCVVPLVYTSIIAGVYGSLFLCIMGPAQLRENSFIGETIVFSLVITTIINFISTVNRLLGQHVLPGLLTGKYHKPVSEERFVMFLDLAGSTSIAEQIGDAAFHAFLNDFFCDLSRPVIDLHGDIYKYVGDEVIITWKKADGIRGAAALETFFAVERVVADRADRYRQNYGVVPVFRAGLHYGSVIVGEMGDYKQEIAILGDVMNTAARIQAECRTLSVSFLASATAIGQFSAPPAGLCLEPRGTVALRGKERGIDLYSVSRAVMTSSP